MEQHRFVQHIGGLSLPICGLFLFQLVTSSLTASWHASLTTAGSRLMFCFPSPVLRVDWEWWFHSIVYHWVPISSPLTAFVWNLSFWKLLKSTLPVEWRWTFSRFWTSIGCSFPRKFWVFYQNGSEEIVLERVTIWKSANLPDRNG